MIYAKIENEKIKFFYDYSKKLEDTLNNKIIINPKESDILSAGYEILNQSEKPTEIEGYFWSHSWIIQDGQICSNWESIQISEIEEDLNNVDV